MSNKILLPVSIASVFLCGLVLTISYEASGHSAWSMLVSCINNSAWENVKPFALVFIMWSFIELSVLRPRLLHFVSARCIALLVFVLSANIVLCLSDSRLCGDNGEWIRFLAVALCLSVSEIIQALLYRSEARTEILFIPLMISFGALFFALLFCTFFPPDMCFFRPL